MKKTVALIVIISLALGLYAFNATAEFLEYSQIVGIIEATAIDGVKVFTDAEEHSVNRESWNNPYEYCGAAFIWYKDSNNGVLQVFDNIYLDKYTQWNCKEKEHARVIMDILPVAIPDNVYAMGGEIVFLVANEDSVNNPIVFYHFNPSLEPSENAFSDAKKFSAAVKKVFDKMETIEASSESEVQFQTLKKGSKGKEVIKLQNRLNDLGYSVGKADGDFGKKTEAAVKDFQEANGIDANGIVDSITFERIFCSDAVLPTPAPTPKLTNTPKPTNTPRPTNTPKPANNTTDWAAIGRALDAIDTDGDGYLSYDEIFK